MRFKCLGNDRGFNLMLLSAFDPGCVKTLITFRSKEPLFMIKKSNSLGI